MDDMIKTIKNDLDKADDRLNKTLDFTKDVNAQAREVKNEALDLLNEVNNLMLPVADVPGLDQFSKSLRDEARRLGERYNGLLNKSAELKDTIEKKNADGVQLLIRAEEQQANLSDLVIDIHDANNTVTETIQKWTDKLEETERIYKDLLGSDSDTEKSRLEAVNALQTIPEIKAIIQSTIDSATKAQNELEEVGRTARDALNLTVSVRELEKQASEKIKQTRKGAEELNKQTDDLLNEDAEQGAATEEAETKLKAFLGHPLSNGTLVEQAKENVGKAVQETSKVSDQVTKLLGDVQTIISELSNTPDIDEDTLDRLDKEIEQIETKINETKLEDRVQELQQKHKIQASLITEYNAKIEELERDVDNIKSIVESLPDGCFRRLELEP